MKAESRLEEFQGRWGMELFLALCCGLASKGCRGCCG